MDQRAKEAFTVALFRLTKASPVAWAEFEKAFSDYVALQCEDAVQAPVAETLAAHGRAQAYLTLRADFRSVEATYGKIATRK